jgi:kinesin family protein 6/9
METKQAEVFNEVAKDVIDSALDGYNGTIFAYGQTGSGKTYTITGGAERVEDKGIIPRTLNYIFNEINKRKDYQYEIKIAYLEIYNNDGYDLLPENTTTARALEDLPRVRIRENASKQFILTNLKTRKVDNEEEALYLLMIGDDNRVVAETPKNDASTRSHCLFMIQIESQRIGDDSKKISKLHIVDLSGSESKLFI